MPVIDPNDLALSDVPRPRVAAPVVSIIVVSYNTAALTEACLASVKAETVHLAHEIIVVDNASTDDSVDVIASAAPEARLIALDENIGFAAANNLAAQDARGEYILLLNPDTVVLDNAIGRLVSFARCCPDAEIWGGRTLFGDGTLNPLSCHGRMTLWTLFCRASGLTGLFKRSALFNSEAYGGWARDTIRRVDIVSGCFLLIRRALWHELSGFDTRFFMYGDDADLCLRARRIGAAPLVTPQAEIVHYGGASETVRADKLVRLLAAKSTLLSRHFDARHRRLAHVLLAGWPLSRMLALSLLALARRTPASIQSAAVWREVWIRRSEWFDGYDRRVPNARGLGAADAAPRTG
ncbi:MAG: glycosyltransferase family 2 protein [Pseudomonadota bacterium]